MTPLLNNANGEFEVNGIRGDARAHAVRVGKRVCSKLDSQTILSKHSSLLDREKDTASATQVGHLPDKV